MTNRNKLASILLGLALAISAAALGCNGGGSSEIEDTCEDFCKASTGCGDVPDAQGLCEDECADDFDQADEFDGEECVDAQLATLECAEALACADLLKFITIRLNATKLGSLLLGNLLCVPGVRDCCETELLNAVVACPETVFVQ